MPKYEKVDDHTLKIVVEKANHVTVNHLVQNRIGIQEEYDRLGQVLKNIDEMLLEAHKLGITAIPEKKTVKVPNKNESDPNKNK